MQEWLKGLKHSLYKQLMRSGADEVVDALARLYAEFIGKGGEDEGGSSWLQRFYLLIVAVMFFQGWLNSVTIVPVLVGAYFSFTFISNPINTLLTQIFGKVANTDELRNQAVDIPLSELLQPQVVEVKEDLFAAFDRVVLPQLVAGAQTAATWIMNRRRR